DEGCFPKSRQAPYQLFACKYTLNLSICSDEKILLLSVQQYPNCFFKAIGWKQGSELCHQHIPHVITGKYAVRGFIGSFAAGTQIYKQADKNKPKIVEEPKKYEQYCQELAYSRSNLCGF